jgi:hypothetical protein
MHKVYVELFLQVLAVNCVYVHVTLRVLWQLGASRVGLAWNIICLPTAA